MASAELLLHPVRLRIVQASMGRDSVTTRELAGLLPDVPPATLYRHVGTLVDANVLVVVDETRVRGGVERTLRLDTARTSVDPDDPSLTDPDALRAGFLAFLGSLASAFDGYASAPRGTLEDDLVGFRQVAVTATDAEWRDAIAAINAAIAPLAARTVHSDGARRRVFATVSLPVD